MTPTTFSALAAYARLSRKADGSLESTELQKEVMARHAERNGNQITAWFEDPDLSAWDVNVYRPGWEAYLDALASGAHDGAMSYHFDRLARNGVDAERLLTVTQARDLPLITPESVLDLGSNADARMVFRIQTAVATNQSDATSRRTRNHKDGARRRGLLRTVYGGNPPLGFRQGDDDWEIDTQQAAYLAEAAKRVLNGESVLAVHRTMAPITDSTGRTVTDKMLRNALTRPASAGLVTSRDGEVIGRAPAGGPLDEATFTRLERLFTGRKVGRPAGAATADDEGRARYPFGPVLRCAKCGNQLTGQPGYKGRGYYACKNPHKALGVLKPCRGVSVAADDVHTLIADTIQVWATTPAARLAAARTPQTGGRRAELETELAELEERLADLDEKQWRMRNQNVRDRYAGMMAETERDMAQAAAELAALAKVDAQGGGVPVVIEWDAMTDAEKLRTLAEAVEIPIVVQPGNGGGAAIPAIDRVGIHLKAI
jgi:DNA invertase Pin-like site-specific DNA recombinase